MQSQLCCGVLQSALQLLLPPGHQWVPLDPLTGQMPPHPAGPLPAAMTARHPVQHTPAAAAGGKVKGILRGDGIQKCRKRIIRGFHRHGQGSAGLFITSTHTGSHQTVWGDGYIDLTLGVLLQETLTSGELLIPCQFMTYK